MYLLRKGRLICGGTADGNLLFIDPNSMNVLSKAEAHPGSIADMDIQDNYVLTCGYTKRQTGFLFDALIKVFDLRTRKALAPLSFRTSVKVRFHPKLKNTAIIFSISGQFSIVDIGNLEDVKIRQSSSTSQITSLDLAPSGFAMAVGNLDGSVHLWTGEDGMFTDHSQPVEWVDDLPAKSLTMSVDSRLPLNSVAIPYYDELLLSSWPSNMVFDVGLPPPMQGLNGQLDSHGPAQMTAYRPQKNTFRNQRRTATFSEQDQLDIPQFKSEQKKQVLFGNTSPKRESKQLANTRAFDDNRPPKPYRRVEIKYSKFGIEDFDFG